MNQDVWSQWLLERRHGGDVKQLERVLAELVPIRDRVLENSGLREGETLLDVGCGDGLIAFGALNQVAESRIIFSDVSQDLLDHARRLAQEMNIDARCRFVHASAESLAGIVDGSVDAVTTRSVLIYVEDKQAALDEFSRVLVPGGRISLFEPINRFGLPEPDSYLWGYDVTPVLDTAQKVKQLYQELQPFDSDPMLNFDERDLIQYVERAGFKGICLELQCRVKPREKRQWETFVNTAWNPKMPTLHEAMKQVLTTREAEKFAAHLRPLVEDGSGTTRLALAFLRAEK